MSESHARADRQESTGSDNTRALLETLEQLRDTLGVQVTQLAASVERLRAQVGDQREPTGRQSGDTGVVAVTGNDRWTVTSVSLFKTSARTCSQADDQSPTRTTTSAIATEVSALNRPITSSEVHRLLDRASRSLQSTSVDSIGEAELPRTLRALRQVRDSLQGNMADLASVGTAHLEMRERLRRHREERMANNVPAANRWVNPVQEARDRLLEIESTRQAEVAASARTHSRRRAQTRDDSKAVGLPPTNLAQIQRQPPPMIVRSRNPSPNSASLHIQPSDIDAFGASPSPTPILPPWRRRFAESLNHALPTVNYTPTVPSPEHLVVVVDNNDHLTYRGVDVSARMQTAASPSSARSASPSRPVRVYAAPDISAINRDSDDDETRFPIPPALQRIRAMRTQLGAAQNELDQAREARQLAYQRYQRVALANRQPMGSVNTVASDQPVSTRAQDIMSESRARDMLLHAQIRESRARIYRDFASNPRETPEATQLPINAPALNTPARTLRPSTSTSTSADMETISALRRRVVEAEERIEMLRGSMLSVLRETSAFDNSEIDQLVERIFERRMDRVARLAEREIGRGGGDAHGDDDQEDPIDDDDDDDDEDEDENDEDEDDENQDGDNAMRDPGSPPLPPGAISTVYDRPRRMESLEADAGFNPSAYISPSFDTAILVPQWPANERLAPNDTDVSPSSPITGDTRYGGNVIVEVRTTEQTNANVPRRVGEAGEKEDGKSEEMAGGPREEETQPMREPRPYRSILDL